MSPSVPLHAVTVIATASAVKLRIRNAVPPASSFFSGERGQDSNGKTRLSTPAAARRHLDQVRPLRGHWDKQRVGTSRHDLGGAPAPAAFPGGAATARRARVGCV